VKIVIKCEDVIAQVQYELDEPRERCLSPAAQQHLAACDACASAAAQLRHVHEELRNTPHQAEDLLPAGFHARLMQQVHKQPRHTPGNATPYYSRAVAACAGIAAVLACVMTMQSWMRPAAQIDRPRARMSPVANVTIQPTPDELAAGIALANLGSFVDEAELPAPARVYAQAAPAVADFTSSLYDAATALAQPLSAYGTQGERN
jgi:hypothetical protein